MVGPGVVVDSTGFRVFTGLRMTGLRLLYGSTILAVDLLVNDFQLTNFLLRPDHCIVLSTSFSLRHGVEELASLLKSTNPWHRTRNLVLQCNALLDRSSFYCSYRNKI
jgi:hypothetical protein